MSRVTVPVYRPDLAGSDVELVNRLQALAELEIDRVRARYCDHELSMIKTALTDGLARVTAGAVEEQHAAAAAAAVQRGENLAVELISTPTPAAGPTDTPDHQG